VPGVVDEHADCAVLGFDLPDGCDAGLLVGYVQLEDTASCPVQLAQVSDLPCRRPDRETSPDQGKRGRMSDA